MTEKGSKVDSRGLMKGAILGVILWIARFASAWLTMRK